jgi:fatty-acyl-CoA synthase
MAKDYGDTMKNKFEANIQKNLNKVQVWEKKTLDGRFDELARIYGDREYIVSPDNCYTYHETRRLVDGIAKGLMKIGLKSQENIGQIVANYPEGIFTFFAVSKIGCVNVPFNFRIGAEDLKYVLNQSDSVCLITMDEWGGIDYIGILKQLCPEIFDGKESKDFPVLRKIVVYSPTGKKYSGTIDFYDLIEAGRAVSDEDFRKFQRGASLPDDVVDIMYTSGTTGKPKGVMLTHDMLWRKSYCSLLGRAFEEGRRILVPLPFYHVFGFVEGVLASQWVGGAVILQSAWDPSAALKYIEMFKANDILTVPTMGLDLLNVPDLKTYDLSSLQAMYCAGAPAPLTLWKRLVEDLGLEYLNTGYGMTETSSAPIQSPYFATVEQIASRCGVVIPGGAAGSPEYGGKCIEYKTVDEFTGNDLAPGTRGELVCRGNVVTKGYYKKPVETAAVIDEGGWLKSGDVGMIHEDGYLEIVGRNKEIFRVGGENVSPKEVEDFISTYDKVNQVYVVGVPDKRLGEIGMAFIELKKGMLCDEKEIIAYCQKNLARFKVPKYVVFLQAENFPKTTTGKIQKYKLLEIGRKQLDRNESGLGRAIK